MLITFSNNHDLPKDLGGLVPSNSWLQKFSLKFSFLINRPKRITRKVLCDLRLFSFLIKEGNLLLLLLSLLLQLWEWITLTSYFRMMDANAVAPLCSNKQIVAPLESFANFLHKNRKSLHFFSVSGPNCCLVTLVGLRIRRSFSVIVSQELLWFSS